MSLRILFLTMKRAPMLAAWSAASSVAPPTLSQYLFEMSDVIQARTESDWHIDGTMLCENISNVGGLVVEYDVGSGLFHESDLVVRTRRSDDF